jgi:hypothetical protein
MNRLPPYPLPHHQPQNHHLHHQHSNHTPPPPAQPTHSNVIFICSNESISNSSLNLLLSL